MTTSVQERPRTDAAFQAVEAAEESITGRFERFHRRRLLDVADTLLEALGRTSAPVEVDEVLRCLVADVALDLDAIAVRALITSFREAGTTYAEYDRRLATLAGAQEVESRSPELSRLLDLAAERGARNALEVVDHLEQDLRAVAGRLGLTGRITSIRTGRGDSHDGGRSVAIVGDHAGRRVVHKPAPADQGDLLRHLASAIDPSGDVLGPVVPDAVTVASAAGRAHAWQRFVEHEDLPDLAAVGRWYRRYGALVALATAIGATDLHFENIVATADGPVVIDVETITSARTVPHAADSAHGALADRIDRSALHSMLVPTRFLGSAITADISGLRSAATAAATMPAFAIVDEGLDTMRFDDTRLTMPVEANAVTCGGEPVDARDHVRDLVEGLRRGRAALWQASDAVDAVLESATPREVRQVVRPTWVYSRFLEASTHPAYLDSADDRRALLERLPARLRSVLPAAVDQVLELEVEALMDLDVPSFHLQRGSTTLHARTDGVDRVIDDAVTLDLEATLRSWVRDHRSDRSAFDEVGVVAGLASATDDAWDASTSQTQEFRGTGPVLVRSGDGRQATWLSTVMIGAGLRLAPVNLTLYEGGGQLVALADAARRGVGDLDEADLKRVLDGAVVHDVPQEPAPWHLSPYTGPCSDHVALVELQARGLLPDRPVSVPTTRDLPRMLSGATAADLDHLNGLGGHLRALRVHADHTVAPDEAELSRALDDLLREPEDVLSAPDGDGGLAHGLAGRVLALADAAALAGGHERAEAAVWSVLDRWEELVVDTDGVRDDGARASWCKGVAGTVLAHEQALRTVGASDDEVHERIEPELALLLGRTPPRPGAPVDASFCHGVAGGVTVRRDLGSRLSRPDLVEAARRLVDATAGARPHGGLGRAPDIDTFFLGSSSWTAVREGLTLPALLGGLS